MSYSYYVETDSGITKINDSSSLFADGIDEDVYQRQFTESIKRGVVKGFMAHSEDQSSSVLDHHDEDCECCHPKETKSNPIKRFLKTIFS